MNPLFPLRMFRLSTFTLGAALLSAPLANPAALRQHQQQQSSQSPPPQSTQPEPQQSSQSQQPTPKPRKIWTNEDVVLLRTPADVYQAEKEAREVAEAETEAKEASHARLIKDAGSTIKVPATVEEAQRMIKAKEGQISDAESGIERMNNELPSTPEDQKAAVQKEIDRVTADLQKNRVELGVLQNHLQKLHKTPATQSSPAPPQPPSPPN